MEWTVLGEVMLYTAVLSLSGLKVKAIPATTKGTEGWVAGNVVFGNVAKCICFRTA